MRSRNLGLLLAGVTVALVTLFVSWRFGLVFFLLPLFFVWSWGGHGGERAAGGDEFGHGDGGDAGKKGPGRRPPAGPGLDGEGI
jgi:hypothetical protein